MLPLFDSIRLCCTMTTTKRFVDDSCLPISNWNTSQMLAHGKTETVSKIIAGKAIHEPQCKEQNHVQVQLHDQAADSHQGEGTGC